MPKWWNEPATKSFVTLTGSASFLVTVLLLLLLSGCSTTRSAPPTPELQANLRQPCPPIAALPDPFVDPDRAIWENALISQYGDCAGRHRATVDAWPK